MVGIGLQSGKIILHNLKFDETVMSFHQEWGPVIGLTFRTGIRLVRPFSQLFLFPIAFPLVIVGDKWLKKWKIGIFNKKREKKRRIKRGSVSLWKASICLGFLFFSVPSLWHDIQATRVIVIWMIPKKCKVLIFFFFNVMLRMFSFLILQKWVSWAMGKNNLRIRPS